MGRMIPESGLLTVSRGESQRANEVGGNARCLENRRRETETEYPSGGKSNEHVTQGLSPLACESPENTKRKRGFITDDASLAVLDGSSTDDDGAAAGLRGPADGRPEWVDNGGLRFPIAPASLCPAYLRVPVSLRLPAQPSLDAAH